MKHYTHLSMKERCLVATFLSMDTKVKVTTMANRSGRHRSTIYRELKRNKPGALYMPGQAHELAKERHPHPPNKIDTEPRINKFVLDGLSKGWSPEQISGRIRQSKKDFYVCHESIYRYIYRDKKRCLYKLLPRKKPRRYFQRARGIYQKTQILKRNISHRPEEINLRNTIGHWEGDTIQFPIDQKSCVTTLVERKSRFVCLHKNENKKSNPIMARICEAIKLSPKKMWNTLAFDQGSEFMAFRHLERHTKCQVFFCDPRSPWQRGSNENMNGRLRRFLPKKLKIDDTKQEDLDRIAIRVNNTPRKCLGYETPREVIIQHFKSFCRTTL